MDVTIWLGDLLSPQLSVLRSQMLDLVILRDQVEILVSPCGPDRGIEVQSINRPVALLHGSHEVGFPLGHWPSGHNLCGFRHAKCRHPIDNIDSNQRLCLL